MTSHKDFFYGSLFYHMQTPALILDVKLDKVVDANDLALQLLQINASELFDSQVIVHKQQSALCGSQVSVTTSFDMMIYQIELLRKNIQLKPISTFCHKGREYVAYCFSGF